MSVQFSLVNQATDPMGNVATVERDADGLAVVTIDRLNRISRDDFDGNGNITRQG